MTKPQIKSYEKDAKPLEIAGTLRQEGAVIIREVLPHDVVDELVAAAEPLVRESPGPEFYGENVRTCSNLFGRDPVFAERLLSNSLILDVLDGTLLPQHPMGPASAKTQAQHEVGIYDHEEYLRAEQRDPVNGPNCHHYRVHFSGSIQLGARGGHQVLHREMDAFRPFIQQEPDQPDWVVAVNYACTDFTEENGATRVVPGSHRWPPDRAPREREEARAVMPKGSALFWLGKAFHALATNTTDQNRAGLLTIFSVNWLTQEENQFVAVPPEFAKTLPEQAQRLLGYRSASLGYVAGRDAENILREGFGQPI